jgi:hypothetical protein
MIPCLKEVGATIQSMNQDCSAKTATVVFIIHGFEGFYEFQVAKNVLTSNFTLNVEVDVEPGQHY